MLQEPHHLGETAGSAAEFDTMLENLRRGRHLGLDAISTHFLPFILLYITLKRLYPFLFALLSFIFLCISADAERS